MTMQYPAQESLHRRPRWVRPRPVKSKTLPNDRKVNGCRSPGPRHWRPTKRSQCADIPRPCPYVGCKYNLYCDVTKAGGLKLNFPDLEPEEMIHSCALDIAEDGGIYLEEVGALMNLTRERVRQVETIALLKLEALGGPLRVMWEELEEPPATYWEILEDRAEL